MKLQILLLTGLACSEVCHGWRVWGGDDRTVTPLALRSNSRDKLASDHSVDAVEDPSAQLGELPTQEFMITFNLLWSDAGAGRLSDVR